MSGFTLLGFFGRGRIPVDAQQEIRVGKHSLERELNPVVKALAVVSAGSEKLEQCLHVSFRHGPAIRQARHPRKDLRRADALFRSKPGMTDENRATAGGVLR